MPVTLYPALPSIAFSKNPIWLKLTSDDFLLAAPAAAVNYVEFTGPVDEDTAIALNWTGAAATMTAKDAPNNSGFQFPAGSGDAAYTIAVLPYFQGNYFLSKYFDVTVNNAGAYPRLIFTAKTKGPEYNFTEGGNVGTITPGVSDLPKANFRHHVQLWMADPAGTMFTMVDSANYPLDHPSAGLTSVDIHDALHSFLETDLPSLYSAALICKNSVRKCFVRYAQFYGSPDPAVMRVYQSDDFFVTKGGLSKEQAVDRNIFSELQPDYADQGKTRMLRQGSHNKIVRTNQPEWLTWLNLTGADQAVELEVTIYSDDDNELIYQPAAAVIPSFEKWQFQVGHSQLDIPGRLPDGITAKYYTARLKGADGYLSASYAYVIDYNYEEWPRYFVYENAYGAFQTLCTTGKGQQGFDKTKDDARYAVDQRTAGISGEFLETNITIQDKLTVNTGYNRSNPRDLFLLRDFYASRNRFLYGGGKLTPIGILTKDGKDAPDGTNVYAGSFEYYPLYDNDVVTENPFQEDLLIDELLVDAGSAPLPLPPADPGTLEGYNIPVPFGDPKLSIVAGKLRYSWPKYLAGRTGYPIYNSPLNLFFRAEDIAYNNDGYFDILVPGFALGVGEQLIIWPFLIANPL